jgi:hypothetical protein
MLTAIIGALLRQSPVDQHVAGLRGDEDRAQAADADVKGVPKNANGRLRLGPFGRAVCAERPVMATVTAASMVKAGLRILDSSGRRTSAIVHC